jgi:hypothetical protein
MKSFRWALLLGFADWLLPFAVSFAIFPLRAEDYYLFESLLSVTVVFAAVFFAILYFKRTKAKSIQEGFLVGALWLIVNLAIDLALFLPSSPMQMSFSLYLRQIGIKYVSILIVATGFGYLLANMNTSPTPEKG